MITELRKSINAILFERVTSPLFGSLIVSWLIWNWRIIYLTLFVDESKIESNKVDYIIEHYLDIHLLITFPLISTVILITVIPFISNGAFWVNLKFKQWRIGKKNEIKKKQLLTIEQSINIRKELSKKEAEFEKLLERKDTEISSFKIQISELEQRLTEFTTNKTKPITRKKPTSVSDDFLHFKQNKRAYEPFEKITTSIRENSQFPSDIKKAVREYYLINGLVEEKKDFIDGEDVFYLQLTNRGNSFYIDFFNEKFLNGDKKEVSTKS